MRDIENHIAVIGLACRFPGAEDPAQFWDLIQTGGCGVTQFTRDQLLQAGQPQDLIDNPNYVAAKGVLNRPYRFDAELFGTTPMEACLMDPQHRVFLEQATAAMEDAGYGAGCDGPAGVFAGAGANTYLLEHVLPALQQDTDLDAFQAYLGAQNDFLATRAAFKLNLHGPAVTLQTACSTSLTAVHAARESLLAFECDIALAGGVCISFPTHNGYLYTQGGILSRDGRCRTFDAESDGTVTGNGAGVVVLKRLQDALADRDPIRAVLLGSAVNNDGDRKVGFTAPSVQGQAEVIARALVAADLEPDQVQLAECHGTATPLGDPIEIQALRMVYRNHPLHLSAVKSNIGHLDAAAGIAGFIKCVLALQHQTMPPVRDFNAPNPNIDFGSFQVVRHPQAWPPNRDHRRACVSSFGIGGTNAHAVLEEAPAPQPGDASRPHQAWIWSAATPQSRDALTQNLAAHTATQKPNAADTAYTLQLGRKPHAYRAALVVGTTEQATADLQNPTAILSGQATTNPSVTFLFNGMGSVFPGATMELYRAEPIYRQHLDACCDLFTPRLNQDPRHPLFAVDDPQMTELLYRVDIQMALVFSIGYAMAKFWMDLGVQPARVAGVSAGEYAAACIAEVLPLTDMAELIAHRGRLTLALPEGAMLYVPLSPEQVQDLNPDLHIGSINTPESCVVTGTPEQITAFQEQLNQHGIKSKKPRVNRAFHSEMMDPMLDAYTQICGQFRPSAPKIPCFSGLTGDWLRLEDLQRPDYWPQQMRQPAQFHRAFQSLLGDPGTILLETGPTHALRAIATGHPKFNPKQRFLTSMPHPESGKPQTAHHTETTARLWIAGSPINWKALYGEETRNRLNLPTYPFAGQDHRLTTKKDTHNSVPQKRDTHQRETAGKNPDPTQWFHFPALIPTAPRPPADRLPSTKILIRGGGDFAVQLAHRLTQAGAQPQIMEDTQVGPDAWIQTLRDTHPKIILHTALYTPKRDTHFLTDTPKRDTHFSSDTPKRDTHFSSDTTPDTPKRDTHFSTDTTPDNPKRDTHFSTDTPRRDTHFSTNPPKRDTHLSTDTRKRDTHFSQDTQDTTIRDTQDTTIRDTHPFIQRGYQDLLDLAAALDGNPHTTHLQLMLVGDGLLQPKQQEHAAKAAALGPLIAMAQERVDLTTFAIDLSANEINTACNLLINELAQPTESARLLLAPGQRRLLTWQPSPAFSEGRRLRKGGVYLITGGLGDLGLNIADLLADHQATIILLSRRPCPEDQNNPIRRSIQAMIAKGSEVLTKQCDVTQEPQLRHTIAEIQREHGPIHGLFHAAGVIGGDQFNRPTHLIDQAMTDAQFNAKVLGMQHLSRLLPVLDFRIVISSIATALGGPGSAAYAAANHQLNALAEINQETPWTALSLDMLDGPRISANERVGLHYLITPEEIRHVIAQAIDLWPAPNILVASGDLESRLDRWLNRDPQPPPQPLAETTGTTAADANPTQAAVAQIWCQRLGLAQIGLDDNYFDLGGDSFIAVQLLAALKRRFNRELPVSLLIDAPSVRGVAEWIDQKKDTHNPLITRLQTGDPEVTPLFLIHPAGGGVYFYRDLVSFLKPSQSVYGIQAVGLREGEEPHQSIAAMAAAYLAQIKTIQPEGPYQLMGASLGGVIAHQMAVTLRHAGEIVAFLGMIDTAGPGLLPQSLEEETDILLYLASDIGLDSAVFQAQFRAMPLWEQRATVLNSFFKDADADQNQQALRFLAVFRENMRALSAHRPRLYDGPITFYQAQSHRETYDAPNPSAYWHDHAAGVTTLLVGGNHITMNRLPNVQAIAVHLNQCLSG